MKKRILIDTDIAMGIPNKDVDDGLAIIMALSCEQLEIDGITLTYGNDSLTNVAKSMANLLKVLKNDNLEIANGASSNYELNTESDASRLFKKKLSNTRATIVSIGPVTNIASAINLHPHIIENIDEIVVVAGRQPGQRFLTGNHPLSHPDLNFERDPKAMQILLDSKIPITMAPFEVSSKVWFNKSVIDLVKQKNTDVANYVAEHSSNWLDFWQETFSTKLFPIDGFNPFDTLAIAWLTDRDLLSWSNTDLVIESASYDLTETSVQGTGSAQKSYLHARLKNTSSNSGECRHKYIYDVSREEFLTRLIDRLG